MSRLLILLILTVFSTVTYAQPVAEIDREKLFQLNNFLYEQRDVTDETFDDEMKLADVIARARHWVGLLPQAERLEKYLANNQVSNKDHERILLWMAQAQKGNNRLWQAEAAYQKLIRFREKASEPDRRKLSISHNELALVQTERGKFEEAQSNFAKAIQFSDQGSVNDQAQLISNQASVLDKMGRHREASPLHRRALDTLNRSNSANPTLQAQMLNGIGVSEMQLGQYQSAGRFFKSASEQSALMNPQDPAFRADLEGSIGMNLIRQDRYLEAEPHLRNAVQIARPLQSKTPALLATALNNLGVVQMNRGLFDLAEKSFGQASFAIIGSNTPQSASIVSNEASAQASQGKDIEARIGFGYALSALERQLGPNHPALIDPLDGLAGLELKAGNPERAEPLLRRTVEIYQSESSAHPNLANAYNNWASSLVDLRRTDEAVPLYRKAISLEREIQGRDSRRLVRMIVNLSYNLTEDDLAGQEALSLAQEAVQITERRRNRRQFGGSRDAAGAIARAVGSDSEYDRDLDFSYAHLIKLISEGYGDSKSDSPEGHALRDQAFRAAQAIGTSKTAELMTQTAIRKSLGEGKLSGLIRRQQELIANIRSTDQKINAALSTKYFDEAKKLRQSNQKQGAMLDAINKELIQLYPDYFSLMNPRSLSISEVQSRLEDNEAVILVSSTDQDVVSFGIAATGHSWNHLPHSAKPLKNIVRRLRCQLDTISCPEDFFDDEPMSTSELEGFLAFDRKRAHHLYDRLVKPYTDKFGNQVDTLYIVSNGPLSGLPFAALVIEEPEEADDAKPEVLLGTRWLSDRYAITHLPSLSILRSLSPKKSELDLPFIGYGAPTLGGGGSNRGTSGGFFSVTDGRPVADGEAIRKMTPLPATRTELTAISQIMSAAKNSIFLGDDAIEPAVRQNEDLSRARIISFATHGVLPAELDGLAEPGLVLTPPVKASIDNDGLLTASEVAALNLSAEWVILSACNTATSDGIGAAHSLSSLSQAFLQAGSRALLASHWYVGDDSTAALTTETIRSWKTGNTTRGKALQQAMRSVRTGKRTDGSEISTWLPKWAHPSAWAAFTHISYVDE